MHEIFTDKYYDLSFHLKTVNQSLFKDFINLFNSYSGLKPEDTNIYFQQGGDMNDYCAALLRGCGNIETVSVGQIIGEYACDTNDTRFLDILVKHGFDLSPIMIYAAKANTISAVFYCLSQGVSTNVTGNRNKTPLYYAIDNVSVPMVRLLLDCHADPSLKFSVAQLNYLDHALWVYENYYSSEPYYDECKIKIVELLIDTGVKMTKQIDELTEGQQKLLNDLGY